MENTSKELTRLIERDDADDFHVAGADGTLTERSLILASRPVIVRREASVPAEGVTLGRVFDVVLALGLLVALLPVMLIVAAAVRLSGTGPVVFAQTRVGKGNTRFRCYKFRSMYDGAEQILARLLREDPTLAVEWQLLQKLENDPRITPLGRILRMTSLDELPQLFNVLKGEMSLVGPRPVIEMELERYGRYRSSYLGVKPGLTGLWQVTGRSGTTYRRRVATDHLYFRRKSLAFDMRILFATVPAVIMQHGAC